MIAAASGNDLFDSMLGDIDYPKNCDAWKLYPFKVRCGVVKQRPPRHDFFQPILDMGKGDIDRVLDHRPLIQKPPMNLTFVFPERWMSVGEQVEFMSKLMLHPDVEKIECVDILTSSPLIIGGFLKQQVRILSWPNDK